MLKPHGKLDGSGEKLGFRKGRFLGKVLQVGVLLPLLLTMLLVFPIPPAYAYDAGNALHFDGDNDYAEGSGVSTSLTTITLEAWVRLHDPTKFQQMKEAQAALSHSDYKRCALIC